MQTAIQNSIDQQPDTDQLSALLKQQYQLAQTLQENINAVTATVSVTKTDYSQLESLLVEKTDILKQLEHHNNALQAWLTANGFPPNAVSEAITAQPDNSELTALWQAFKQIIDDCQLRNGATGTLVRGRLQHTRQTLNLLTGRPINTQPAYTVAGKCDEESISRKLAKA